MYIPLIYVYTRSMFHYICNLPLYQHHNTNPETESTFNIPQRVYSMEICLKQIMKPLLTSIIHRVFGPFRDHACLPVILGVLLKELDLLGEYQSIVSKEELAEAEVRCGSLVECTN